MVDERRLFLRFLTQFPISLFQDGVVIGDGTCYELSAERCTVAIQANVGTGGHVALQLYLPDQQDPTTPLLVDAAAASWTIQQQLGLKFISLSSGDQQRLRQYIKTHQPTSP